jgi:von Willebrand factor A domain-containing protein 8
VGKNKVIDKFLELIQRPREYIQLHRDTTLSSLTVTPVVENGFMRYKDSPLLRAVQLGRVLVIDEADKAPVSITAVLKSLAESGDMLLADGRRIVNSHDPEGAAEQYGESIVVHPEFRMVLLANRPGYPFMGNDFFSTIGDVFSCHPIDNPGFDSEMAILQQAAPTVHKTLLTKLVKSFGDLRQAFDDGLITYPYSLRELLHVARHMEAHPNDSVAQVLRNVFDFDLHRRDVFVILEKIFKKHGYITI